MISPLAVDEIRKARAAARLGATILYRETTESTNSDVQQLGRNGAAEGTVVIADQQTRGRGRLGRAWTSPAFRNLYLSLLLRPPIAVAQAPQLGLVAGVAAAQAIRELCERASLKWPNDVLIDGRKVCGILTEMEAAHDAIAFVVVGIGVNLNMSDDDFPPDLRDKAIGLAAATGRSIDRVVFTVRLLDCLQSAYESFLRDGFAALRGEWEALSSFLGRSVDIDDGKQRYSGVALGLADDGALRLRMVSGEEVKVVAGDVTVIDGYAARS